MRQKKRRSSGSRVKVRRRSQRGLRFSPYLTNPGVDPLDEVEWERREASIINSKGEAIFKQEDIEVPATWS
jgi:ribonucleoside-diphosphate reductase alpha chain